MKQSITGHKPAKLNTEVKGSYSPLVNNMQANAIPKFHLREDSRFTTTPLPKSHQNNNKGYSQNMLDNNHDIIETPMSVNRPKFDFSQSGQN
jgi:hypothetical protein